jgi:hypothetical protein
LAQAEREEGVMSREPKKKGFDSAQRRDKVHQQAWKRDARNEVKNEAKPVTFDQWIKFKPSERRLRLFAVACAAYVDLPDPRSRAAVEAAARYADGLTTDTTEMFLAWEEAPTGDTPFIARFACRDNLDGVWNRQIVEWLANTPACPQEQIIACIGGPWVKCERCEGCGDVRDDDGWGTQDKCPACHGSGVVLQPATLCGTIHQTPIHAVSEWRCHDCRRILAWQSVQAKCEQCGGFGWQAGGSTLDQICPACSGRGCTNVGTVVSMAQAIYEDGTFADLPILADALEDAGCENKTILNHLRAAQSRLQPDGKGWVEVEGIPAVHVRGCYVLDLILGKS